MGLYASKPSGKGLTVYVCKGLLSCLERDYSENC